MGAGKHAAASGSMPSARKLAGLFTKEDTFNIHKTFGIACLFHFIYRFRHVGLRDMNFGSSYETLGCIFMHAMLSVSSLIFRIPIKRIAERSEESDRRPRDPAWVVYEKCNPTS